MEYRDFHLMIERVSLDVPGHYWVRVHDAPSPARATLAWEFPSPGESVEDLARSVAIGLRGRDAQPVTLAGVPAHDACRVFGERLFREIFRDGIRDCYVASETLAQQQGWSLRVRLSLRAPELAALPWEFLYDPRGGQPLCLLDTRPVVRTLRDLRAFHRPRRMGALRVLAMIGVDPTHTLDLELERRTLDNALAPVLQQTRITLRWVKGRNLNDLRDELLAGEWHVFHFAGHGSLANAEGGLLVGDDRGGAMHLSGASLAAEFAGREPRLVVLNCCNGARGSTRDAFASVADQLARGGVPAVLAMQSAISDAAATRLCEELYKRLARGGSLEEAVTAARREVQAYAHTAPEWATPVLYLNGPDGQLFWQPPFDKRIIIAFVLLLFGGAAAWLWWQQHLPPAAVQRAPTPPGRPHRTPSSTVSDARVVVPPDVPPTSDVTPPTPPAHCRPALLGEWITQRPSGRRLTLRDAGVNCTYALIEGRRELERGVWSMREGIPRLDLWPSGGERSCSYRAAHDGRRLRLDAPGPATDDTRRCESLLAGEYARPRPPPPPPPCRDQNNVPILPPPRGCLESSRGGT